jgi:hypothetical protein
MIDLLDLYTTYNNISQIIIFDWTLSTSDHTTLIHSSLSSSTELPNYSLTLSTEILEPEPLTVI